MIKSNFQSSLTVKKLEFEFLINNEQSIFKIVNAGLVEEEKGMELFYQYIGKRRKRN